MDLTAAMLNLAKRRVPREELERLLDERERPPEQQHLRALWEDQLRCLKNKNHYCHWHPEVLAWCADVWSNFVRNKKMPDSLNEDDWVQLASAAPQTFEWLSELGRQARPAN